MKETTEAQYREQASCNNQLGNIRQQQELVVTRSTLQRVIIIQTIFLALFFSDCLLINSLKHIFIPFPFSFFPSQLLIIKTPRTSIIFSAVFLTQDEDLMLHFAACCTKVPSRGWHQQTSENSGLEVTPSRACAAVAKYLPVLNSSLGQPYIGCTLVTVYNNSPSMASLGKKQQMYKFTPPTPGPQMMYST